MSDTQSILHNCLYFTANSLARVITRMADEAFRRTGLSPSHAFLMMLVNDHPGITQKALGQQLQLAPSTVTRFVDALVHKGFLTRQTEGKKTMVYATVDGEMLRSPIARSWESLHQQYAEVLGLRHGDALTAMIDEACAKLSHQC